MAMDKEMFKQSPMVNWYKPGMLFQTAMRTVVSGIFGNYADRRETEAALTPLSEEEWNEYKADYAGRDEIWMDFIGDTGDGFNSTFSVASLCAQASLKITGGDDLPRGKLLLLGGDQVYPTPAGGLYKQKFSIPFDAALPEDETDTDPPDMYAIPGNHDWYDGLSGFLKLFCQQRKIGNWHTRQRRSYFARPLPHNYWIWGTDIQLNEDIDKPQLDYFMNVATMQMDPGAKVILITAEPAWIYRELNKGDTTYLRFNFFIDNYITGVTVDGVKRNYQIATVLTGDLHHYSHYCTNSANQQADHYFGAGGGGAFMHLTHNLPEVLNKVKQNLKLEKRFPDEATSRKLLLGNLLFFIKNRDFSALMGIIYILVFWLLKSSHQDISDTASTNTMSCFLNRVAQTLAWSPLLALLSLLIVVGFWKFTDTSTYAKGVQWFGLFHGLLQCFSIYAGIWLIAQLPFNFDHNTLLFIAILALAGGIWGGLIMGIYLLLSNLIFGNHITESSSSLAGEDYKCFLKLHINKEGLEVYPIGIKQVTKNWKTHKHGGSISFSGKLPEAHLIEGPIHIKNN